MKETLKQVRVRRRVVKITMGDRAYYQTTDGQLFYPDPYSYQLALEHELELMEDEKEAEKCR